MLLAPLLHHRRYFHRHHDSSFFSSSGGAHRGAVPCPAAGGSRSLEATKRTSPVFVGSFLDEKMKHDARSARGEEKETALQQLHAAACCCCCCSRSAAAGPGPNRDLVPAHSTLALCKSAACVLDCVALAKKFHSEKSTGTAGRQKKETRRHSGTMETHFSHLAGPFRSFLLPVFSCK